MLHSNSVLAYYIFDDHWTCSVLVKICKNILGFDPPYFLLNTALLNHVADVPNATAPRA